jgi:anti-sigma factor RsiW
MSTPRELLDAHLDGVLTPGQELELAAWLRADAANVETFVRETHMHHQVRVHFVTERALKEKKSAVLRVADNREKSESQRRSRSPSAGHLRLPRSQGTKLFYALAIAAGVMAALFIQRIFVNEDSPASVAALTAGAGGSVYRGEQVLRASAGMKLYAHDRIVADSAESCSFAFSDGSTVELNAGSACALQ